MIPRMARLKGGRWVGSLDRVGKQIGPMAIVS
jgi:hypothetical protein